MARSQEKLTEKSFHFTTDLDIVIFNCSWSSDSSSDSDLHVCGPNCLKVVVTEVLNPSYGLYVWPCAPVLAQYIWWNKSQIFGKRVLELGAGTALPSIVAAKCEAHVVISDGELFTKIFDTIKRNLKHNEISAENFEVKQITWGSFSPSLLNMEPPDIILGSDVFYELDDFEDIVATVSYLLQMNPHAEFWCSYEERNPDWNIEHLLDKWDLKCEEISLESFGASKSSFTSWNIPTEHKIQMFVFKTSNI